ncbi:hypothetical protein BC939DRAFT_477682 [Gamsiella multidivaricata]|uniref:uncharacterized protein n=1 Tax=Gamsiella multidivaricata TaxID=101098 RepID=UPI0022202604|nr:uncharacterized protein BC939DRAFT_477682 [Gamsiella multidivaricata]KAI7822735.1 hypothetical protein BC939DRAFT_477682 [Gamsiella multidivaricata]
MIVFFMTSATCSKAFKRLAPSFKAVALKTAAVEALRRPATQYHQPFDSSQSKWSSAAGYGPSRDMHDLWDEGIHQQEDVASVVRDQQDALVSSDELPSFSESARSRLDVPSSDDGLEDPDL